MLAVDDFVTNEMVAEMFNILGFHLPNTTHHFSDSQEKHKYFDPKLYCKQLSDEDLEKQEKFLNKELTVANIANSLTSGDIRSIIRCEDSAETLKQWYRLFPTKDPAQYQLLPSPSYSDCLLHGWLLKHSQQDYREDGLDKINELCNLEWHLKVPEKRCEIIIYLKID